MSFIKQKPMCDYTPKFRPYFQYELPPDDVPLDAKATVKYTELQARVVAGFNQLLCDSVRLEPLRYSNDAVQAYFGRAVCIGHDGQASSVWTKEKSVYVQPSKTVIAADIVRNSLPWEKGQAVYDLGMFLPYQGFDPLNSDEPLFAGGDLEFGSPWTANADKVGWLYLDLAGSGPDGSPTTHDLARTEHFRGILNSVMALKALGPDQATLVNA